MIGETISHYKILEKLGEGGMGVVYKAQDLKLDRLVALKFLPAHVAVSEEIKARFLQEAKAAAALNHAHICTIHGVEEEGTQMFIVMEYIEGGTLREKLPIPKVNDALSVAIQIGEGLQEAHLKGIVHRDIKADNVMLTSKGQAKVMDFGLAKLKGSLKLTRTSSTVGTLAYMAPEQVQGGEVDSRSDIFSFGVLLFEMLTGKTPFRGEHEAAMVYSIVNETPDSVLKHRSDLPAELDRIIARALEKDAEDRYQHADDLVSELRRVLKQSSKVSRASASSTSIPKIPVAGTPQAAVPDPVEESWKSKKRLWIGVATATAFIMIAGTVFLLMSPSRLQLNPNITIRVLPIPFTQFSYPGLSRDANWIAFPAADANNKWDVYYMHVSGSNSRRLTTDSIANGSNLGADISPDGSQIAYTGFNQTGPTINIVSSVGGLSKTLTEGSTAARWRPDGQRIGYVRFGSRESKAIYTFWSMKADGSDNRLEYADTLGFGGRFSFNWSPDGKSIAWIRSFKEGYQEIFTHELETGKERQLTNDKKNSDDVAWTSNGFIIYSSNRGGNTNLWMVPVTGGTPQQLTKGSGPDIGISASADDQKLVYLQQQQIGHIWDSDLSTFRSKQLTYDDRQISGVALSFDGKKIALVMGEIDPLKPAQNLYLQDRDGTNRRQLTFGEMAVANPAWSPDGKWISFSMLPRYARAEDSAKIFVVDGNNPGTPTLIATGIRSFWLDTRRLVARNIKRVGEESTSFDEQVSVDGGSREKFLGDSTVAIDVARGNMVVYYDNHHKTKGMWIVAVDYAKNPSKYKPRKLATPNGAVVARSMNSMYYVDSKNDLWRMDYSTGKQERIKSSFPGLDTNSFGSVSKDDKELIYVTFQLSAKLVMMENIFK
jgi:serine/threonine protein kinase